MLGTALALLLLLPQPALAQDRLPDAPGPAPLPGRPFPGGPPAPGGPKAKPLSFEQSRSYAARAASVVQQLQVGSLSIQPTPQGPRLRLTLTFMDRPVASVNLKPDLSFAERPAVPLLDDVQTVPTLTPAVRQTLNTQVRTLAASGLAQVTGPHVRVALLSHGAAVADLRFDRASGILLAEPAPGGPKGPKPDPKKGQKALGGTVDLP